VLDNFSNSHPEALIRVGQIAGRHASLIDGDIRDTALLVQVMREHECEAVIHFAGLKSVSESIEKPLDYYDNNVVGTLCLLKAMQSVGMQKLVFSSSAVVYGEPLKLPITEDHPLATSSPYGRTKQIVEEILTDWHHANHSASVAILRYFNPVGAHSSGLIGEDPLGVANNLMPLVSQVAIGQVQYLKVFGGDYPTPDGSGVRDFIHVVDLAKGHLRALESLNSPQCSVYNLGTGRGYSVLEVVNVFERICGMPIARQMAPRRPGDISVSYADPARAEAFLGWKAEKELDEMCADHWRWQQMNPQGYSGI
jgi:UDP-glucose 4-epimerase